MHKSTRSAATTGAAVFLGTAGLSYLLAGAAEPSAEKKAAVPLVKFTAEGKLKQPIGYRKWIYIGTPLTPNDLNGGEAAFPEFHAV